jgi:uncharacterized protein
MKHFKIIYYILAIIFTFSCKPQEDKKDKINADLSGFLSNYSNNIILPSYTKFQTDILALESKIDSYSSTNHSELKPLIDSAYISWQACAMFEFGPASTYSLSQNINIYPVDTTAIKQNISNKTTDISPSTSAPTKGLASLDYLIYKKESLNADELAYIKRIIDDIQYRVDHTIDEWKSFYSASFIANTGYDAGSSLCFLSNAYVKYFEREFRHGKVGIPVGVLTSGVVQPSKVEALYSHSSHLLLKASIKSLKEFYYGKGGLGFDYLLKSDDSSMSESTLEEINLGWTNIETKINAINTPIDQLVSNNKSDAQSLYNAIQAQLVLLKIDMISSLSLKIKYIDEDGD